MGSLTGKENEDSDSNEQRNSPVTPRTFIGDVKINEGNKDSDHGGIYELNIGLKFEG